jgi:hypothetical protein
LEEGKGLMYPIRKLGQPHKGWKGAAMQSHRKPKQITPEQLAAKGNESSHQSALFCWATQSGIDELKWMFHIPNGGSRNIVEAGKLVAGGVKSGVPDIFLPVARFSFKGLWIELKKPGSGDKKAGVVEDNQRKWLDYLCSQGYATRVCYGWVEARDAILEYLQVRTSYCPYCDKMKLKPCTNLEALNGCGES